MTGSFIRSGWVAGAAALILAVTVAALDGQSPCPSCPTGEVLTPRLGEFSPVPADPNQTITFKGWVDGYGGSIDILVQTRGTFGLRWWKRVGSALPKRPGTLVNGVMRYDWEFTGRTSEMFAAGLFEIVLPDGGTARIRVRANSWVVGGGSADLAVRDGVGVFAETPELVLSDIFPSPVNLPAVASPNYLNRKPTLTSQETFRYYASVGTAMPMAAVPRSFRPCSRSVHSNDSISTQRRVAR